MENDKDPNPSGAPEAGGATTPGSLFGGDSLPARLWRFLARHARDLEAHAYRRLAAMEKRSTAHGEHHPGAPKRTKEAAGRPTDENRVPIS
jgi:hypothetical protein